MSNFLIYEFGAILEKTARGARLGPSLRCCRLQWPAVLSAYGFWNEAAPSSGFHLPDHGSLCSLFLKDLPDQAKRACALGNRESPWPS